MKYMLLIYSDRDAYAALSAETQAQINQDYFTYTQQIVDSGEFVAGDPLQGVETATTVRSGDGRALITDGPFAETKEVFGGFYLLDAYDLDGALDFAARIPATRLGGSAEVRPLMETRP